jgi:uncharacterized protein YqjF (DUF2071 family)
MKSDFLTAAWRKLLIINYSVDPAILEPYLPYKTELDLWKDKCYVSLVGFRFLNTRVRGIPIPFHRDFEEINLRFYVRYKERMDWKRGVTFIKEIVPRPAITFVANTLYREKYVSLKTAYEWSEEANAISVAYRWKHEGDWDYIQVKAGSTRQDIQAGSEEEFITEHYWGYTKISDRLTSEYEVVHPRWTVYPVLHHQLSVRFAALYGAEFGFLNNSLPDSVMLAEGSDIAVRASGKIV